MPDITRNDLSIAYESKGRTQDKQRRNMTFIDQHGRKWHGIIELSTGDPLGPVTPVDFTAPWLPSVTYMRRPDPLNRPADIEWDYDLIETQLLDARETYLRKVEEFARELYGDKAGEVTSGDKLPRNLREIVGTPPLGPEMVQACRAGNRWALLGEGEMPAAAKPFMDRLASQTREQRREHARRTDDPFAEKKKAGAA